MNDPKTPDPAHIPELPDDATQMGGTVVERPAVPAPAPEKPGSVPSATPPIEELEQTPVPKAAASNPGTGNEAGAEEGAEPEKPPLRPPDKAPRHLGVAALIVCAGSLLPWMGHGGGWITAGAAKALVFLGSWFWLQQVLHNWGPKLPGALGKLAQLTLKPRPKADPKKARRSATRAPAKSLAHPFPTALQVLSLVTIGVACALAPQLDQGVNLGKAMAELGMLAWAAYTWVHIKAYERWGNFNPLFPLMFLAMVASGALQVISGTQLGLDTLEGIASTVGGGIVAAGGLLAAYTIVEAMLQAKKEGDVKKRAQAEARRSVRKSTRR